MLIYEQEAVVRKKQVAYKYWSKAVTQKSNALDLEHGVFTLTDPHQIALSLRRSARRSRRRKGTEFQSAMSMLNFYINRAGKKLPASRLKILNQSKTELRKLTYSSS